MATTRISSTLLTGTENADAHALKPGVGKPRAVRTALGNISNRAVVAPEGKKVVKDGRQTRALAKSKATTQLHKVVEKENPTEAVESSQKEKEDVKAMDISATEVKLMLPVGDIDKDDGDNPQLVSEYVNDIYEYMRDLETTYAIKSRYLENRDVSGRMRGILIDWLVQVHLRFHLLQETLYLTVAIIDRFLQEAPVTKNRLQLVGVTSMLVASKYEEMYAPEIGDFEYITDNAYQKSDIRKMECLILKTLGFNLGRPLPLHFLRRNSKAGEVDATQHTLAKYLMELTIVDYDMAHINPSEIAAAALCMSMKVLNQDSWSDTLTFYSNYTEKQLLPVMRKLACLVQKAGTGKLTAIYTKYKSSKFMRISVIPELQSQVVQDLSEGKL